MLALRSPRPRQFHSSALIPHPSSLIPFVHYLPALHDVDGTGGELPETDRRTEAALAGKAWPIHRRRAGGRTDHAMNEDSNLEFKLTAFDPLIEAAHKLELASGLE